MDDGRSTVEGMSIGIAIGVALGAAMGSDEEDDPQTGWTPRATPT